MGTLCAAELVFTTSRKIAQHKRDEYGRHHADTSKTNRNDDLTIFPKFIADILRPSHQIGPDTDKCEHYQYRHAKCEYNTNYLTVAHCGPLNLAR